MLSSEGYKMFRGSALMTPACNVIPARVIEGDWLYKPDTGYWYCNGRSYSPSILSDFVDYDEEIKSWVKAIQGLTVTAENVEQVYKLGEKVKEYIR